MKVEFYEEQIVNEYGSQYGITYIITGPSDADFFELQQELIEDVIGEDYYYGQRDVWNQISIEDGRK